MPAAVHHLVLGVEDLFILHALRKRREVHELLHRFAVRRRHQCVTYLPKTHRCAFLTPRDFRTLAMIRYLLHGILHEVDPYDGRVGLRNRRDDLITKLRLIERRLQFLLNCGLPLHDRVNAAEADQRVHLSLRVIRPDDLRLEEALPGRCRHALVVPGHTRLLRQHLPDILHTKPGAERFPRFRIKIGLHIMIYKFIEVRIVPVQEATCIGAGCDMQDAERPAVDIDLIDGGVVDTELVQHLLLVRELLVHLLQLLVLVLLLDDLLLDVVENAHAVARLAGRQRLDAEVGAGPLRYDVERLVAVLVCCPVVVRQPLAAAARTQLEVALSAKLLRRRALCPRQRRITVVEAPVVRRPGLVQQHMDHTDPVGTAVVDVYIPELTLICRFCSLIFHRGFLCSGYEVS